VPFGALQPPSYEVITNAPIAPDLTPSVETFTKPEIKSISMPDAFTKKDLADLVNEFENELFEYKTENAKLDISMFNDDARKTDVKAIDEFQTFVTAVKKVKKTLDTKITTWALRNLKMRIFELQSIMSNRQHLTKILSSRQLIFGKIGDISWGGVWLVRPYVASHF